MESEAQNYSRESVGSKSKSFSLYLEEAKEMKNELLDVEKMLIEEREWLKHFEEDLNFLKESNEFAASEGSKGISPEETEKVKENIEFSKKRIAQLENAKLRIDDVIMRWRAIDSRWEDLLIKGTPPTEH